MNKLYIYVMLFVFFCSCKKDFLEIKPDQGLLIPKTLTDLRALLDNTNVMNIGPGLNVLSTDEYQILSLGNLNSYATAGERNAYIWKTDIFDGEPSADWEYGYRQVFYANVVLEGLEDIEITDVNRTEWNEIKGAALFSRGIAFYQLVSQFAAVYEKSNLDMPGIPLKLKSDVNEKPDRGTVQHIYTQLLDDLNRAIPLLPDKQNVMLSRPGKLTVYSYLARIYLSIGNYNQALDFSDKCIKIKPDLLDYNSLSKTSTRPISLSVAANSEVIHWQWMIPYTFASYSTSNMSAELISSYDVNDLRKVIYFRNRNNGIYTFKGNYTGDSYLFIGTATDEMYLIRAECRARLNDVTGAMEDLNSLMKKRWNNTVPYVTFTALNDEEALTKVLIERKKELVTRGTRWTDLRRFNKDIRYAVTLKRNIDNIEYILPPNDERYVFPIPIQEK